jgi:methyl-accepting chemotaxis protein
VGQAGQALAAIQEALIASTEHMGGIGRQSHEQSREAKNVAGSMDRLLGIAEQNAAATEEMAVTIRGTTRAVDNLSRQDEELGALVSRFHT